MANYPSYQDQLTSINRAIGQLEAVKRMIDRNEYCVDIMRQLKAARQAVKTIELKVLETHMHQCLAEACKEKNEQLKTQRIDEIMALLKKYQ